MFLVSGNLRRSFPVPLLGAGWQGLLEVGDGAAAAILAGLVCAEDGWTGFRGDSGRDRFGSGSDPGEGVDAAATGMRTVRGPDLLGVPEPG